MQGLHQMKFLGGAVDSSCHPVGYLNPRARLSPQQTGNSPDNLGCFPEKLLHFLVASHLQGFVINLNKSFKKKKKIPRWNS